ncbi:HlyD family efflux transporter periplasmic adaptor subunit [Paenibacillus sp. TRM 82003]|uniref:efflux RND transporter periplasmic adaptor subunit n=1 Tax=Kineococcus sp. TRM81007 TaxID=2925831 RepID=UPI001F56FC39|nr:HlyD family efflux transporter periplasmic adaptor subunit [Kineococcus sp. TRM81007]MCI2237707.1 HlyD family efflux transporter periplasmic adaptor subunit [Kineococcus sp. TRM81007]MCI3921725.1 HlyD family efflux transporter periplasmic adaptor subunit [Paenibacillus sp. TRM 82003]
MRSPLLRPAHPRAARRLLPATATAAVAALLLAGCGEDEEAAVSTAAVQTGAVREVVEASGTVQPRASSTVAAPATGTVATLEVTDGQQVQAGQVLATIDSPQAHDALEQAREADRRAAAAGSSSSSSSDPDEIAAQQRRARADAQARFAQAEEQAAALPDAVAREAALAAVRSSRTQYELLAGQTQALVEQVAAGLGDVDAAVAALGQAQRVQTRAAVAAAQATVDALTVRAPIAGTVSLAATGSTGAGLPAGAAALLQGGAGALPEGALAGATNGQDLGAAGAPGSPVLAAGAAVNAGAPLLSVIDASVLTLTADVDESDVLRVQPGQVAEVVVDAVEGATYRGTVTGVDPSATGSGGAVTYTVRLSYDGGSATGGGQAPTPLPGMSAVVSLVVAEADDAVRVPAAAVVRGTPDEAPDEVPGEAPDAAGAGGAATADAVWVVRDGVAERRDVTVGVRGQRAVQITEGLRAGERIVTEGAADVRAGQQLP